MIEHKIEKFGQSFDALTSVKSVQWNQQDLNKILLVIESKIATGEVLEKRALELYLNEGKRLELMSFIEGLVIAPEPFPTPEPQPEIWTIPLSNEV